MIKLKSTESKDGYRLLLHFSDNTCGTYDFTPFIEAATEMTTPLSDPPFFSRYFIELGALAWPNGFDLSAESLHRRLQESGGLRNNAEAA
ncbi:DUF2442 domain-containing protein [Rhodanobacter sp. OK091]|uniref:DUF2442 domain-containing protein n=1 Tax=Rhodanobacter sp. OK091 TaxID=1881037 RepID=UPI00091F7E91|nr:DUF2442 domain-containing protein [Rhodanobacter sp. OK091]SHL63573.1 Protein of unknown function [Rhodanobacter sp. OK091]